MALSGVTLELHTAKRIFVEGVESKLPRRMFGSKKEDADKYIMRITI
jgi:hypothetical protein